MNMNPLTIQYRPTASLSEYAANARTHSKAQVEQIADSIAVFGFVVPILAGSDGTIIAGHGRLAAAQHLGMTDVPVIVIDHLAPEQRRLLILADNKLAENARWDTDLLKQELTDLKAAGLDLSITGFAEDELTSLFAVETNPKSQTLAERFLVPPFSVLDARQSYWQQRKAEWIGLGIESEVGRGDNLLEFSAVCNGGGYKGRAKAFGTQGNIAGTQTGTSIFDPVLCELAYRWFCPPGGRVLDPFAGGSVRGLVASRLGHHYTGVELRPEQVAANRQQADKIVRTDDPAPEWIEGDSTNIKTLVPAGTAGDFILMCPPYADLEVYSDDARDLSTMEYDAFLASYRKIIAETCDLLADNRFAVCVVGEVRGPAGNYRGFVRDTIDAFEDAGLKLWNDAVLVTAIGSLPIRVGTQFMKSRKLGKTHQNVLTFYKGAIDEFKAGFALKSAHENVLIFAKGNGRAATAAVGNVEVGPLEQPEPETEAA